MGMGGWRLLSHVGPGPSDNSAMSLIDEGSAFGLVRRGGGDGGGSCAGVQAYQYESARDDGRDVCRFQVFGFSVVRGARSEFCARASAPTETTRPR